MMQHSRRFLTSMSFLAAGLLAACSDATAPLAAPRIEGTYTATSFTTTTFGGTIDRLREGVTVTILLRANGTTYGSVSAPGGTAPVVGTWDTAQGVLHFRQETADFLEQLPFAVKPDRLVGDSVLGVTTFRLTLTKLQPAQYRGDCTTTLRRCPNP